MFLKKEIILFDFILFDIKVGEPTNVSVQILVKKIWDIKEHDLSYRVKYDFLVRWKDKRLNWSEPMEEIEVYCCALFTGWV